MQDFSHQQYQHNQPQTWECFWGLKGLKVSLMVIISPLCQRWERWEDARSTLLTGHSEFNLRLFSRFRNGHTEEILLGGCNPVETYARQVGSFPQEGVKIRNIHVNHHLVTLSMCVFIEIGSLFLYSRVWSWNGGSQIEWYIYTWQFCWWSFRDCYISDL